MEQAKEHGSFPIEILNYRHTNPNQKNRQYTIIECVILLPDGKRTAADIFLTGVQHFASGRYQANFRFGVDQRKNLEVRVISVTPQQQQQQRAAA